MYIITKNETLKILIKDFKIEEPKVKALKY